MTAAAIIWFRKPSRLHSRIWSIVDQDGGERFATSYGDGDHYEAVKEALSEEYCGDWVWEIREVVA
jgi:hypothetical protein